VGGLAARRPDQRPCEQKGREQADGTEGGLEQDQVVDVAAVRGGERACRVQRHVRRQRVEDPEALDRRDRAELLVRGQSNALHRPAVEDRRAGRRQVCDEPGLLPELRSDDAACRGRQLGLVVVAVDGRSRASVEERLRTLDQDRGCVVRVDAGAAACEQDLLDVSLGEGPLPRRHLDDRRAILRPLRRPDREGDAERGEDREGEENREDRAPPTRGERPEVDAPVHAYLTTSSACMPAR
jgi:hypothetical protein